MSASPAPDVTMPSGEPDAMSVVIPVYNEPSWVRRCVDGVLAAAAEADLRVEIVVVDDGSTDDTPAVLDELVASSGIRVVRQANAGRFAARRAGVAAAREPWILLLDSRVLVDRTSLAWIRRQLAEHPERQVWCGHVDVDTVGNPYAAYWAGLVKIGWRRYTANPRLVSFGAEEFDLYPKGTTCLLMPKALLLEGIEAFDSMFTDARLSSDDTRMLRGVAERHRIWLAPDFRFRYHGKAGARGFVRQSYFRGTTFVDGYLGQAGVIRRALIAGIGAAVVLGGVTLRKPAVGALGVAAAVAAVPTVVGLSGGSRQEVRAAAALTPVFLPLFGAGVVRGLFLAAVTRRTARAPEE